MAVATAEKVIANDLADELDQLRGQWVAIDGDRVVAAADTPARLLEILRDREITGSVLHHVPDDPQAVYIL